jgi:serine/threonine protein phosphatase PrpC
VKADLLIADEAEPARQLVTRTGLAWGGTRRSPGKATPTEDCAGLWNPSPRSVVIALADGMGGAPSGERASRLAMEAIEAALGGAEAGQDLRPRIMDAFELANRNVLDLRVGAGTTLVVVEITDGVVRSYHAGDSVAVLVGQRGHVKLETIPHSPVGYGVASGMLGEKESMVHEDRSLILNCVGSAEMRLDVSAPVAMARRDTVFLASDGIVDNVHRSELLDMVRVGPLGKAAKALEERVQATMAKGDGDLEGHWDDATFVVYRRSA